MQLTVFATIYYNFCSLSFYKSFTSVINIVLSYNFSDIRNSRMHYIYNNSYYFINNECTLMVRCLVIYKL